MVQLTDRLEPEGRRIVVLAGPGDRRDEDLRSIAQVCAGHFDCYICRRDDGLRGRDGDEVPRILRQALLDAGVPEEQIELIPDEASAVDSALHMARTGDLVLLFVDAINRSWKQVIEFKPDSVPAPARSVDRSPPPADLPVTPDLGDLDSLVRDERGVRLARETED
jgi:cyanophycin synthetase